MLLQDRFGGTDAAISYGRYANGMRMGGLVSLSSSSSWWGIVTPRRLAAAAGGVAAMWATCMALDVQALVEPPDMTAHSCRAIAPGPDDRLFVEDMAIDPDSGLILLASHPRGDRGARLSDGPPGYLRLVEAGVLAAGTIPPVKPLTDPAAYPHGVDVARADDGSLWAAAVRRRPGQANAIDVLHLNGTGRLERSLPIQDAAVCRANDVLLLGPDRVLVSNDRAACDAVGAVVEDVTGTAGGNLIVAERGRVRAVATGIAHANGLALGPPGVDDRIFVSATRGNEVLVYDRESLERATDAVDPIDRIAIGDSPDNLSWAPDGRLLVAVLPNLFRLALYYAGTPGIETVRSRIDAVDVATGEVETLFQDDGSLMSAATTAVIDDGRLVVGSLTANHLVVCDLPAD